MYRQMHYMLYMLHHTAFPQLSKKACEEEIIWNARLFWLTLSGSLSRNMHLAQAFLQNEHDLRSDYFQFRNYNI